MSTHGHEPRVSRGEERRRVEEGRLSRTSFSVNSFLPLSQQTVWCADTNTQYRMNRALLLVSGDLSKFPKCQQS